MHFVPIPTDHRYLKIWEQHWLPWVVKISRDTGESLEDLFRLILTFEVQVALVWDDKQQKAHALVGIRTCRRGEDVVGEIIWLTGENMKAWRQLLPQLEQYLRDIGCSYIRPLNRPGWAPFLKDNGYKVTHYIMEKPLWADQAAAAKPR
jgi:hypothetical protein